MMNGRWMLVGLSCAALAAAACGTDEGGPSTGGRDAAATDARTSPGPDGGSAEDAAPGDSGVLPDSGAHDAGPEPDGGTVDSGAPDSGAPDGGSTPAGRLALGQAALSSANTCPSTALAASSCVRIAISGCAGVPDTSVVAKVTEPTAALRGTIVFGNGGPGTAFYEATGAPAVNDLLVPLHDLGFRVVQLAFEQPGWLVAPGGPMAEACRPATALDAIYREVHTPGDGAYCASGNSGGSAMFAYALAHYGAETILDAAVLSSGPPLGRIDLGCLGQDDAAWQTECSQLRTCSAGLCTYLGLSDQLMTAAYGDTHCADGVTADRARFRGDSVLNGLEDLDYPKTEVRFVYGGMDCSEAVPLGRVYAEAITSVTQTTIVPGAEHAIAASSAGATQLFQDLRDGCVLRH